MYRVLVCVCAGAMTGAPNCLEGLNFVISGILDSLPRDDAKALIEQYGGKVTGSISGKTTHLLAGNDAGASKLDKAKEKGLTVVDEGEYRVQAYCNAVCMLMRLLVSTHSSVYCCCVRVRLVFRQTVYLR